MPAYGRRCLIGRLQAVRALLDMFSRGMLLSQVINGSAPTPTVTSRRMTRRTAALLAAHQVSTGAEHHALAYTGSPNMRRALQIPESRQHELQVSLSSHGRLSAPRAAPARAATHPPQLAARRRLATDLRHPWAPSWAAA